MGNNRVQLHIGLEKEVFNKLVDYKATLEKEDSRTYDFSTIVSQLVAAKLEELTRP